MSVRELRRAAALRLEQAGVPSPTWDADQLLAHVLGTSVGMLVAADPLTPEQQLRFEQLLARRSAREPLQHLTGSAAFRHVELLVGPGVFVPRPETELVAGWAIEACAGQAAPVVVDLCTGSGAIAKAVADEVPGARVHAVELDPTAHEWASRNLHGTGVDLRLGDFATTFDDLLGQVDVLVSNPPYVPTATRDQVAPEALEHDPHLALFSGADGLDAIRVMEVRARELLRVGGVVVIEHDDTHRESVPALFHASRRWRDVRAHDDLTGRPRFMTAQLAG